MNEPLDKKGRIKDLDSHLQERPSGAAGNSLVEESPSGAAWNSLMEERDSPIGENRNLHKEREAASGGMEQHTQVKCLQFYSSS